ncbi:MAG: patatin-like phospholipase family protein [Hydrogenophaga sp.]
MPSSTAPSARTRQQVDLALQGGGSHGAFTWGVLDRLLEEEWLEIAGISGTSAGAMNAVALAAGLMEGGRQGARRVLRDFWQRVAQTSPFLPWNGAALGAVVGPVAADWVSAWLEPWKHAAQLLGQQLSPYQINPLNLNPLRDILLDTVDFERVRHCHKTRLFVAATQVRTGALRVFDQSGLTADQVMASACLPLLFQAVEIEGEAYWDGGYAGNPSLMPLITDSPASDLLLVQINPIRRDAVPTRSGDILDRINEVTFNASLVKEMRAIALLKQLIADEGRPGHAYRNPLFRQVEALRVHLIDGGASLAPLGAASKTTTHWAFLTQLHGLGVQAAERWLDQHGQDIGVRSSLELSGALAP